MKLTSFQAHDLVISCIVEAEIRHAQENDHSAPPERKMFYRHFSPSLSARIRKVGGCEGFVLCDLIIDIFFDHEVLEFTPR